MPNQDIDAGSNGRRHCVVTDVVLEEETMVENKEEEKLVVGENALPKQERDDLNKPKAPSEQWSDGRCADRDIFHPSVPDEIRRVLDAGTANLETGTEWRTRARSDCSQCKRPVLNPLATCERPRFIIGEDVLQLSSDTYPLSPDRFASDSGFANSLPSTKQDKRMVAHKRFYPNKVLPQKQVECPF